jgi:hypothetical protein
MWRNRVLWAAVSILMGSLQALDSGVLGAGATAQLLTVLGIAAPAVALAMTEKWSAWIAALIAGAVLLTAARMASIVSLNTLHLGLMVPAIYILFVSRWAEIAQQTKA